MNDNFSVIKRNNPSINELNRIPNAATKLDITKLPTNELNGTITKCSLNSDIEREFRIPRTNPHHEIKSDILCRMRRQKRKYEHVQKISGVCIWEFRVTENLIRGESNIKPRGPITFNIWPAS